MIKLKNVSKYYYSKGIVAQGFSKVNLELKMGEFVVITGESGSGKSTLLNVISGLDTYEEGEMYINGEETSHYTEKDFEDYRRKYIGNIFQNFNLVNSYTVYQNIELVLLLNGEKKKNIKKEVISLIKKVGLYKFRNTKVSKLSGGQKQRVGIARALAKDTDIIIADEPTGNLDSKSSKEIIKLLSSISHDKLVVIVTHNYEDFEKYATRKIKMHDGRILEDKKLKEVAEIKEMDNDKKYKDITVSNRICLAIRNTFNIAPKFLLLLLVYLFITSAIICEYGAFKKEEYINSQEGYNHCFNEISDKRIVVKKDDKTNFTEQDYDLISNITGVDYVVKNDLLLDTKINITDNNNFWIYGSVNTVKNFRGNVDLGKVPTADDEIVLVGSKDDWYLGYQGENLLNKKMYVENIYNENIDFNNTYKVVGIKYDESINYHTIIYLPDKAYTNLAYQVNEEYSNIKILFRDQYQNDFRIKYSSEVPSGNVYISSDNNYLCKNNNCLNEPLKIEVSNIYYNDNISLVTSKIYDKNNFKTLFTKEVYNEQYNMIYVNDKDYNKLFNKDSYQISVFVKDIKFNEEVVKTLNDNGYKSLKITDALVKDNVTGIIKIFKTIVTGIVVITLFFISYFVIRLILKSRNEYFVTLRMLGLTKKISKQLLVIELFIVSNLAYFIFMLFIYLNLNNILDIGFIKSSTEFLVFSDYLLLYIVLGIMSYLLSLKFSKKIFKKSTIKSLEEE